MPEYLFKEAKEEDLPQLLEIYNYYILNSTATFHSKLFTLKEMKSLVFFKNPMYRTFLILKEEALLGYVLLTQHKNREAYDTTGEVTIYLKHDCIGKGIGSAALKYIEDYAMIKNFHVLVATITGENEQSIRTFDKNGYEKCAHYKQVGKKFGRWLDVVAYQKTLDN